MGVPSNEARRLVGCSVIGPKHVEDDRPCQDAWNGEPLDGDRFVVAVGDGLGSASRSHEGSELATAVAVETLKETAADLDRLDTDDAEQPLRDAITTARDAVAEKAEQIDEPPGELETTLLVAVAGPSGVAGAVVGDGGIVCAADDSYHLLVPREEAVVDLPAAHVTIPLMHADWEDSYRFGTRTRCDGVAVFSDGFENFTWDGLDSANPAFFEAVFGLVREYDDPDAAADTLATQFQEDPYDKFGDDKTIVIGDIPPKYEGNEVTTAAGDTLTVGETVRYGTNSSTARVKGSESDALKLYTPERRADGDLQERIQAMVASPPETVTTTDEGPSFAWPLELVESTESGQFVGYRFQLPADESRPDLLEAAKELAHEEKEQSQGFVGAFLRSLGIIGRSPLDDRYDLALSLARAVDTIHQQDHAFGDLHHETFLVVGTRVIRTDCERMHVTGENVTCEGDPGPARYEPPEGTGSTLEEVQQSDRFGLAIHVFQLLMDGYHPYDAEGTVAIDGGFDEMIRSNHFPYRDPIPGRLEPPADAPPYAELPEELRTQFERCFIEGKSHPTVRPTAGGWVDALESLRR